MSRADWTRWTEWAGGYPLLPLAIKAALAAALAWLIIRPFAGVADDYPYYAPLGAVVVVSSKLAHTLHTSAQTVLAIALGTSLALLARQLPVPGVVALALVVGLGTIVGAWRPIGEMAGWVPIAGLFTLVVGGPDPERYMFAYLGLTAVGAVVGLLVNVIAPPLPLIATRKVQNALREMLADRLEWLGDGLDSDRLPRADEWVEGQKATDVHRQEAEDLITGTLELSRLNWRARRRMDVARRQLEQGQALGHLAFLVDEMAELLAHEVTAEHEQVALGRDLRAPAARALRRAAEAVRSVESALADAELLTKAVEATDEFADAIENRPADCADDSFVAGNLVVAVRRVLDTIAPEGHRAGNAAHAEGGA